MRAVAIDDEKLALDVIQILCASNGNICLEKVFTSAEEGLKYLRKFPVDLVFLDINMPVLNGLDLAKQIPQDTLLVFTTAYSEFAVESYSLRALDYLLKPINQRRFDVAIEKAVEILQLRNRKNAEDNSAIFLRADHRLMKVNTLDILMIEGLADYLKIYFKEAKSLVVRMTMKEMIEKLPSESFVRVSRSYIIPLRSIQSISDRSVVLSNRKIRIGITYYKEVIGRFYGKQD